MSKRSIFRISTLFKLGTFAVLIGLLLSYLAPFIHPN
ncbi:MAG: hypothetical protein RLZZ301_1078, partial [Bacteroidota bacterium]